MVYDTVIVGGGAAGITAAIYLERAGKKSVILEKFAPGGQLNMIGKIENYPGVGVIEGVELAQKLYSQASALGVKFMFEEVQDFDFNGEVKKIICNKTTYETKSVILAMGSFTKPLNIEGEEKFRGRGVSYCATCDGHFFKGKTVTVIGNGDSAIIDAMYLAGVCEKVYLVCERLSPKRVTETLLNGKKVEILRGCMPQRIKGSDKVEELEILQNNELKVIKTEGIFVAIGRAPDTSILQGKLELSEGGYIKTDLFMRTSIDGVYAVGDVRDGALKQIATAVGDGAIAANEIINLDL